MNPRVSTAGRMRNVKAGNVPCQGWAPIAEVAELGLGKPAQILIGDGGAIIGAAGGIPGFDPGAEPAPASRAAAGANLDRGQAWVLAGHRSSLPALPRAIGLKTTAPAVVAPAAAAAPRPLTDRRRQTPVRVLAALRVGRRHGSASPSGRTGRQVGSVQTCLLRACA